MSSSVASPPTPAQRRAGLDAVLAVAHGDLGVTDLQAVAGGLESVVYRAESTKLGPVAIKVPLMRVLSTGNEIHLDTRRLLTQEFRLAGVARAQAVPCPEPLVLHVDDDNLDFLMVEFVETDGTDAGLEALGRLVAAIHALDLDPGALVAMEGEADVEAVVARRLRDRYSRLAERRDLPVGFDATGALAAAGPLTEAPVLLHMDARPANLLTHSGEIRGIVDWSNALVGPPALELARIAESGNVSDAFLAGYGTTTPFAATSRAREVIYRLDTAVMLAHVFLDNDMPAHIQDRQVNRVTYLVEALAASERPDDTFVFRPEDLAGTVEDRPC